jgi:muramidase (phage lysozyme)
VELRSGLDMAHSNLLVMAGKCASAVMMVENVWTNVPPGKHDGCIAANTPLIQQPATHNR